MNTGNNKIVDFELVQVTQCGTSQAMEKYGFGKTLDRLLENKVPVTTVVTDRHVGVRSVVRKEYAAKGICHQFDVYHIANSFRKKLVELPKRKSHADLIPWIKSITNHVWFSSKNCDGNPDKLVELFTSICYHVAGKHRWSGYTHVSQCMHKPYTQAQQRKRKWLKNPTLQTVKNLVYDPRLLRDIHQINLFCDTGSIESFHSLWRPGPSWQFHITMPMWATSKQLLPNPVKDQQGRRTALQAGMEKTICSMWVEKACALAIQTWIISSSDRWSQTCQRLEHWKAATCQAIHHPVFLIHMFVATSSRR